MEDDLPDLLGDAIRATVDDWCIRNGGMAVAFIAAVDYIDADGVPSLVTTCPGEQPTHRSMGLAAYLTEWCRDEANTEILTATYGAWEDDD